MIHDPTTPTTAGSEARSSNEIRSEIRRTRGRMDETLDELGEQLTARSLMNSALDWFESRGSTTGVAKTAGKKTAQTVARHVKENPMPSALVGAGIAWMVVDALARDEDDAVYVERLDVDYEPASYTGSDIHAGTFGYDDDVAGTSGETGLIDKAKQKASDASHAVAGAVGAAKDKLTDAQHAAARSTARVGSRARQTYGRGRSLGVDVGHRVERGYEQTISRAGQAMDEFPLAMGLGFAALGALVGLILPRTRREDELIGERSDEFTRTVKEKGQDLMERGKEVGSRVAETALQEAERQGITAETLGQKASELGEKLGEVIKKTKEKVKTAAKDEGLSTDQLKQEASSGKQASTGFGQHTPGQSFR